MVNIVRKILIMLSNLLQINLNLIQKSNSKKKGKTTDDLIGNKTADKITKI